jgi:uncharacterized protein (DUF1778 family)
MTRFGRDILATQTGVRGILDSLYLDSEDPVNFISSWLNSMGTAALKEERISIRATADAKTLITKAAALSDMSMTDFLLKAACLEAEHVLAEYDTLVLSNRQRDWFLELLDNPPRPNEKLKAAALRQQKHLHL